MLIRCIMEDLSESREAFGHPSDYRERHRQAEGSRAHR
jgi:hypothetical protein